MEIFKLEKVSFTYPKREEKALNDINLAINYGEFVTLCGASGSGKTTLLRFLKSALAPHGTIDGAVIFEGKPLTETDSKEQAQKIGFVMQNPDNQLVTDKVWHELAFGLESLGFSNDEIRARVSEMASFFGIESWFYKNVCDLSGGQKQLLNLASVMACSPSVLILDEPTSQLDPIAAQEFIKALEKINRELGVTVILSEHRLEDAIPVSDRVLVMDGGKIIADGTPVAVANVLRASEHPMFFALPTPMRVYGQVTKGEDYPVTVREGRMWLEEYAVNNELKPEAIPKPESDSKNEAVIELSDVWFRYKRESPDVIKGMSLKIKKGEIFALMGGNGTGKTTVLSLISRINQPYRGEIFVKKQPVIKVKNLYDILGVLPQNPQSIFVKSTVYEELCEMIAEEQEGKIKALAELCRIDHLLKAHPYDLSGGEQQRVALAKVLLKSPEILLFDEPTKGFDAEFKQIFAEIITDLKSAGVTVLMVSHDIEFCAEHADRCALVFDGSITSIGSPGRFFSGKTFYTTSANRMARTKLPAAILPQDIILACGAKPEEIKPGKRIPKEQNKTVEKDNGEVKKKDNKLCGETLLATILTLLAIPLTLFLGTKFLGSRKYYFTSFLIILEAMIPFFLLFEKRRPKAREVVIISVLCAIAVIGRAAFFMLPQFKPVVALVIITGACLGSETGFLVGAVTGFVSNFFLGQGPWTPWQMFSFGLIGFLSGIVFKKGFLPKKRIILCIFGFIATVLIYGGIMNPASIIMWQNNITREMIFASYAVGIPLDLVHGLSTLIFLWFLSEPMIEKLERVKEKYGLIS